MKKYIVFMFMSCCTMLSHALDISIGPILSINTEREVVAYVPHYPTVNRVEVGPCGNMVVIREKLYVNNPGYVPVYRHGSYIDVDIVEINNRQYIRNECDRYYRPVEHHRHYYYD